MHITRSCVLLLLSHLLTSVTCQDCTLQQFRNSDHFDSNFDLSGLDATYSEEKLVRVPCNVGYTGYFRLICTEGKWMPTGRKCEPKSCGHPGDAQFADFKLVVGDDYVFGSQIVYECNPGYHMVSRSSRRNCLANGWDGTIAVCEVNACKIGGLDPNLYVSGLTPTGVTMKPGHKLRFLCGPGHQLDGSQEIECLPSGQWNASFPSCSEKCRRPNLPENVRITSSVQGNAISKGDTLSFACRQQGHIMRGSPTSRCLGDGQWSHPVPQCSAAAHCSAPPPLEDGDTKSIIRSDAVYQTGEKVEYVCQSTYTMQGSPFKTCNNGEWTGNMRCLKPCTLNEELLSRHGLQFRYGDASKLYAPHEGYISFACLRGKIRVGNVPLRGQCIDGQVFLPTCQ